jgi:outer membrane usher protein FimD/PapC
VSPHAAAAAAAVTPAATAAIERLERLSGSARHVGNPAAAAAVAVAAAGAATKYAAAAAKAAAAGAGGGVRDGGALNLSQLDSSQALELSWSGDSCAANYQSRPYVQELRGEDVHSCRS